MKILKKENWWIWLLLLLFGNGASNILLGALLDVYDKDAWYAKWQNWLLGFVCFFFPFFIMILVFVIQITCQVAAKLNVPGKEVYLSPYIWMLMIIVPVIGWIFFIITSIYVTIWPVIMLYRGEGEQYIN
ncbi:MAG: hypothetical protein PHW32_04325 [Bacilli bacterium]|nr:hypothetical protein [Bacilli bacterium]MDD4282967.1 hypothetical protein [Bacilli bacterium]MDD4719171.1 hypothetical protein [Bacilli bacterium]